jgi:phosphinothricin acetyltransferase
MVEIKKATINDINAITEIYNDAILNTNATFDTDIKSISEQKKWFKNHGSKNPIIIAELNRQIVGWAALSKYNSKCAYSDTAELSLYVNKNHQGKGIGKELMNYILKKGEKVGIHTVVARITEGNDSSIHLHEKYGFFHVGILKECGFKFGKRLDVYIMQKIL